MINSSFANGVSSVFDYDVNGRMTHMERFKNGTPPTMLVEFDYGYDAAGNRLYTRDMVATNRSELYGYDARNRLRNFERGTLNTQGDDITAPLSDPVLPSQQQWTGLDRRGNWLDFSTTLNGQQPVQQTREANQVNEITTLDPDGSGGQSAYTLANDHNGNLTENPWAFNAGDSGTPTGQKYECDEENRLTRVRRLSNNETLLEIGYDAFGRRVESKEYLDAQTGQILTTARVTHHVVLGPMTIEEYDITAGPTATLAREFVWGTEFPMPAAIVDWTASGQIGAGQAEVLHYLRDILGNVIALTNASGNVVERYRYNPYGMTHIYNASGTLLPTSAYGNPFAFTGQRYDAAVGLYHFLFRTYSPSLGRWYQRDPIGYVDGVSLYEYCRADPLGGIDRFGALYITPDAGGVAGGAAALPFVIDLGGAGGVVAGAGAGAVIAGGAIAGYEGGTWLVNHTSIENHVGYAIYSRNSLDPTVAGMRAAAQLAEPYVTAAHAYVNVLMSRVFTSVYYLAVRNDLPVRGKPNSSQSRDDGKGHGQIRDYGKDGRAKTDYDYGHDHTGAGDPHAHDWDWTDPNKPIRCPPKPLAPGE